MTTAGELRSGKGHKDENFPVASWIIHPRHRALILAFYNFVRTGDDVADHATLPAQEKLDKLDLLEAELLGKGDTQPEAVTLRRAFAERGMSPKHAQDLLNAFRLDVTKLRYEDWDEVIHYCSLSAMPVGRFMLDVHGEDRSTWAASDAICAALQINNHLQDCGKVDAGEGILEFIDQSQIPLLTINLLQALPRTPLYDRLKREGRLIEDSDRDSNVDFFLPYEHVVSTWRECMGRAYTPERLFARFEHQVRETYSNRFQPPNSKQRLSWRNIKRGMTMLSNIIWHVGMKSDYRREFWKFAWPRLKTGDIERVISVGLVAHHLIVFARDASSGQQNASYYSTRLRDMPVAAE